MPRACLRWVENEPFLDFNSVYNHPACPCPCPSRNAIRPRGPGGVYTGQFGRDKATNKSSESIGTQHRCILRWRFGERTIKASWNSMSPMVSTSLAPRRTANLHSRGSLRSNDLPCNRTSAGEKRVELGCERHHLEQVTGGSSSPDVQAT